MAYLSDYGGIWGSVPQTAGTIHWVAPGAGAYTIAGQSYTASDNNDGLSPERALASIGQAVTNATANAGDVIVALPGTHAPSASIAMSKAGVTLTGLPAGAGNFTHQKTTISPVTGDQTINVTAIQVEIAYLHFTVLTADSAIDATAAASFLHVHHCSFDMNTAAVNAGTIGVDFIGAANDVIVDTCYFNCDGAQGPAIVAGATVGCLIQNCIFVCTASTWVSAITQAAAGRRLIVRHCDWQVGNGAITNGILGTTGGEVSMVLVSHCNFADSVTKGVDGYDAGDAEIVECYQAGLGSTDGGVLVVATT